MDDKSKRLARKTLQTNRKIQKHNLLTFYISRHFYFISIKGEIFQQILIMKTKFIFLVEIK